MKTLETFIFIDGYGRNDMKIKLGLLLIGGILVLSLCACGAKEPVEETQDTAESTNYTTEKLYGNVEITSASLTTDAEGKPAILVRYTWNNTTDHTLTLQRDIALMATQLDKESDRGYHWLSGGSVASKDTTEEIPQNTSISQQHIFTLNNKDEPVTVRIYGDAVRGWIADPDVIEEEGLLAAAEFDPTTLTK